MLATSKIWLDRGGSSLHSHLTTFDQNEEENSALDGSSRQATTMNAWNRDYPTGGAPRSEGQSANLEPGQTPISSAQQTSPFAVTQNAWSASPEHHPYSALPSINTPIHSVSGAPYSHPNSIENNDSAFAGPMNYGSGGSSSEYAMLARPHSSGGNQPGNFQMMANRQYVNPPLGNLSHSTAFTPSSTGGLLHPPSQNQTMGHAPTVSEPMSGGHYTFSSAGAGGAAGISSNITNPDPSFYHPGTQNADHERESYVYSNVQGNLGPYFGGMPGNAPPSTSSSHHDFVGTSGHQQSSVPNSSPHHHHHHPYHHHNPSGGSTYSMLGGLPVGQSGGGHYLGNPGQYEGYPTFYNPFEVKHRRRTTRTQFKVLESTFLETPKPTASTRKALAEQLDMPLRAIQIWFQNRRAKAKTQSHRSSTSHSHSITGGSSTSNSGRFVDSPPSNPSQRDGSGSVGIGRPSTSSSSYSYYQGSKQISAPSGQLIDTKPPLSSSSLSSTGSGQAQAGAGAGAGFPFEDSKRFSYSGNNAAKPAHLSRLDLPPLQSGQQSMTSGEASSGSSSFAPLSSNPSFDSFKIPSGKPSQRGSVASSSNAAQTPYPHQSYNPTHNHPGTYTHYPPHQQNVPSGSMFGKFATDESIEEQNRRNHQNPSWH